MIESSEVQLLTSDYAIVLYLTLGGTMNVNLSVANDSIIFIMFHKWIKMRPHDRSSSITHANYWVPLACALREIYV